MYTQLVDMRCANNYSMLHFGRPEQYTTVQLKRQVVAYEMLFYKVLTEVFFRWQDNYCYPCTCLCQSYVNDLQ